MKTAPIYEPHQDHSAFSANPPPPLAELPPPARPVGRPSTCTQDKIHMVCHFIQATGFSDSMAGSMAGVPRSTLSRWKEDEEVEMQLLQARAQYLLPRLEKIGQTQRPDGQPDWRALAWQVKWATQQGAGARACDSRLRKVDLAEEARQQAEAEWAQTMEIIARAEARNRGLAHEVPVCPEINPAQQERAPVARDRQPREAASSPEIHPAERNEPEYPTAASRPTRSRAVETIASCPEIPHALPHQAPHRAVPIPEEARATDGSAAILHP